MTFFYECLYRVSIENKHNLQIRVFLYLKNGTKFGVFYWSWWRCIGSSEAWSSGIIKILSRTLIDSIEQEWWVVIHWQWETCHWTIVPSQSFALFANILIMREWEWGSAEKVTINHQLGKSNATGHSLFCISHSKKELNSRDWPE